MRVLEWRFGDQLAWRLVVIGLREEVSEQAARSYDPARSLHGHATFRERYGMPFGLVPKERQAATSRGCRAIVAARLLEPGSEWRVLRALQLANFTTPLLLDDDELIRDALRAAWASTPTRSSTGWTTRSSRRHTSAIVPRPGPRPARQPRRRARPPHPTARSASRRLRSCSSRTVAGSWRRLAADPRLRRAARQPRSHAAAHAPPESALPLLERFPDGLTTSEVAALLAVGSDPIADRESTERLLLALAAEGVVTRLPLGQDAIWQSGAGVEPRQPAETSLGAR